MEIEKPLHRQPMAGSAQLIRHPGIEQQRIHHRAVAHGHLQIRRSADPHRFPQLHIQPPAQLSAAFHTFIAVELDHLMAPCRDQRLQILLARIGHHQHTQAVGTSLSHRGEKGSTLLGRQIAGRGRHGDHPHRVDAHPGHRRGLIRIAKSTDLQQRCHPYSFNAPSLSRICCQDLSAPECTEGVTAPRAVGEGWLLFKIRGIPLRIHPTWFVILAIATMAFQDQYSRSGLSESLSGGILWTVAFVTALLLFVSVLLHELGHSLVALSQGVKVRSITLFLLGGVASVERECSTARGALLVAAAGPAVSLALGFSLLSLTHAATHQSPILGAMVNQLGGLNMVLAIFNLLPGLPLDGGLIVKALVWQATGSQRRGVEVASACGRFLSLLAVGFGVMLLLNGRIGGAWLMLLGWFGLGAASNQRQMLVLQKLLKDMKVRDVAQRRLRVLEATDSLRQLSQMGMEPGPAARAGDADEGDLARATAAAEGPPEWVLVCDRGRWRGYVDQAPLQQLPLQRWAGEKVGDHLLPLADLPSIRESAPLWEAVLRLESAAAHRLLVLSPAGLPAATIQRPEVGEAVQQRLGLRLPPQLLKTARLRNAYSSLGLPLAQVVDAMVRSGDVTAPADAPPQGEDPGS